VCTGAAVVKNDNAVGGGVRDVIEAALSRALAFCADSGVCSLEAFVERAVWELRGEVEQGCGTSLAFVVGKRDGSSFVGRPRESVALPAEILLGMLVEDGGESLAYRVKDHALDTVRFIDRRFRTSIVVRVQIPKELLKDGNAALWFGLPGPATPKIVEQAQAIGISVSEWFSVHAKVLSGLQHAHAQIKTQSDRLSEMISVAHDVRAPIGALQYLLADIVSGRPELHGDVTRIQRELRYVDTLLAALSPQGEHPRPLDKKVGAELCSIVERVCERLVPEIDTRGGRFVLAFPQGARAKVRVAELDIERVLANVLGNAVRYAGAGDIKISVRAMTQGVVDVTVSDCGPGFPPSVLDALADGERSATNLKESNGWGVGLVSCTRRLRAVGGDMVITSTTSGASVLIRLPGVSTSVTHASSSRASPTGKIVSKDLSPAADGGRARHTPELIIIDDDQEHAASLERVLSRSNIRTKCFSAVSDALTYLAGTDRARVVCDVHMPDGGAEELLHRMSVSGQAVPCAVMSGEATDELMYRFAALGAREFFAKPAPLERLVEWALARE
jgi:signal transduction histidine kinase/CheY-like chemotaxis protein